MTAENDIMLAYAGSDVCGFIEFEKRSRTKEQCRDESFEEVNHHIL